jgi:hypothetical protein
MPFSIGLGRKLGNVWLMCIAAAMGIPVISVQITTVARSRRDNG